MQIKFYIRGGRFCCTENSVRGYFNINIQYTTPVYIFGKYRSTIKKIHYRHNFRNNTFSIKIFQNKFIIAEIKQKLFDEINVRSTFVYRIGTSLASKMFNKQCLALSVEMLSTSWLFWIHYWCSNKESSFQL